MKLYIDISIITNEVVVNCTYGSDTKILGQQPSDQEKLKSRIGRSIQKGQLHTVAVDKSRTVYQLNLDQLS